MLNSESEKLENETTIEYLERVKQMGMLFHGSRDDSIVELEPRYTLDNQSVENTDTAVFATNNITWTTIFGLSGGNKGWSTSVRNGEVLAKIPAKYKESVEKAVGSVYVLPSDTFERTSFDDQYKSHVPVKPISRVEVTLSDYYQLGGKIEWI